MTVELIKMHHPDIPGAPAATATRQALEEVWADKGWVEGEAETSPSPEEGKPEDTSPVEDPTINNDPEED